MKAKLILFVLMGFTIHVNGQLLDSSNIWNYLEVVIPTCEKSTNCSGEMYTNYTYSVGNDILIHNKMYTQILEKVFYDDTSFYTNISGYLREEQNGKKVYSLLNYINDSTEVLLYDFTLQKDSVFKSTYIFKNKDIEYESTFFESKVTNVDSIKYEGKKRLRIVFDEININWLTDEPTNDTLIWIEGIGSNNGLFDYRSPTMTLLCFGQYSELWYKNSLGLECDYRGPDVGVKNIQQNNIAVYPNPLTSEILTVKSQFEIEKIEIYRLEGTLVENYSPKNNLFNINTTNYLPGLYIIKIDGISKLVVKN